MDKGRINYWWTEIKKEWDCDFEHKSYPKERIFHNVQNLLLQYDEKKYPGKKKHDAYISSKKWKIRREGFLKAELYWGGSVSCYICNLSCENPFNKDIDWNIHHNNYDHFAHQFFNTELEDLAILNSGCHESLHISIDIALQGYDRKMFKEHKIKNGKFFDNNGCLRFGKYQGYCVEEVPESYLVWVENNTDSEYDLDILENR